jgi:phytoene dehydrogenase-like protein
MEKSVVIIGAGIAGLSAGCYARMNGFKAVIVEMHNKPGGLCTAWERKGYTFDGCIHWLVGSAPGNDPMRQGWEELGAVQGKMIIDHDIFMVIEDGAGKSFTVYEDANKLEKEMLRLAPEDDRAIRKFTGDIIKFSEMPSGPPENGPDEKKPGFFTKAAGFIGFMPTLLSIIRYGAMDVKKFRKRFKNPFLSMAIGKIFGNLQEFTALGLVFTLAWMHRRNAGYPVGGSLEFIRPIEERYLRLGGEVLYNSRVEKIIVEDNKAAGVLLLNGKEIRGDIIISAADGHSAIYGMLDGKYKNSRIDRIYSTFKRFPSIVQVSIGVKMDMAGAPQSLDFPLEKPIEAGKGSDSRMTLRIYAFDKTMAPEGCTAVSTYLSGDYEYWTKLRENDKIKYDAEKKRLGDEVIEAVNKRFPGFRENVEVIDVATPATYERYTGNWMASFEGWLMTPATILTKVPDTLPGLEDFYMIGQWTAPGGGLPSGLMTGKSVIQKICKANGMEFTAKKP